MVERLLIVGRGSIGGRHLRLARELLPTAHIAVLGRPRPPKAGEAEPDACFATLEEALRFAPEAAVIANPAPMHVDVALPLARQGVHLLIEKPLSDRSDRVADLLTAAEAAKSVMLVGYNLRFAPALRTLRELVRDGAVGRVLSVRAEVGQYLPGWRPGADYRDSVSAKAALGGGALLELSHEIDYLRWLLGDVAWVSAIMRRQGELEIDTEDTVHLVLGFAAPAGAKGVVARADLDFIRQDSTRSCVVIGESGTVRWDALAGTVSIFKAGASSWSVVADQPPARDETYRAEWAHFLACIGGTEQPLVTGADGLAVVRIAEAARRSSDSGAVVQLSGPVP